MQKTLKDRTDQAIANGMRIMGQGTMTASGHHFWLVCSEGYASGNNTAYVVEQLPGHLTCNCPDPKPCKHICLISRTLTQALKDERQPSAEQVYCEDCGRFKSHCDALGHANPPAPWSRMGQAEAERLAQLPRELANVTTSEAEKLELIEINEQSRAVHDANARREHREQLERVAIVEKLAEPMKQNAAPWEVERYKALTLADEEFMQMALAAQRAHAEPIDPVLAHMIANEPAIAALFIEEQEASDREMQLVDQMVELEHDDAMLLLDRETTDDEWEEEEAEPEPSLTIGQRAEHAILADQTPEEFSIFVYKR